MGNEQHDFLPEMGDQGEAQAGPSWASSKWPLVGGESEDDLTQALDPSVMKLVVAEAAKKAGKEMDEDALQRAADDSNRAMMLIRTFRVRGHLAANLDPLGLSHRETPEDLTLEWHGFAGQEDREVYVGGVLGYDWVTVGELYARLREIYAGHRVAPVT